MSDLEPLELPDRMVEDLARDMVQGGHLILFLDYDGTLADFAPTPEVVQPDPELIVLLSRLTQYPDKLRVVVLSGRGLSQVDALLPVPGLVRAGTYGIEFHTAQGDPIFRQDFATNRPVLDQVKPRWEQLLAGREGFYLEDKGWSIALHARSASPADAEEVLDRARHIAAGAAGQETFRLLGGSRFLELAPATADKGQSVAVLLDQFHWPKTMVVYFGDDDKDEQAFGVVKQRGGIPVLVSAQPRTTLADYRLPNPAAVRSWLALLARRLEEIQLSLSMKE